MADPKWTFNRERCALLVIDMQNDFVLDGAVMQVKSARDQVPAIRSVIDACHSYDIPVIYTTHLTDAANCPGEIAAFPWLADSGMRAGDPGCQVIDELAPQPQDLVLPKRRFSAFYQTDLELQLRNMRGGLRSDELPIDTLIIVGTVTHICCESTARDAFFRDYKVVFGSDLCSCDDPEIQRVTLKNMDGIFGRVLSCDEILAALERGEG